MKNLMLSLVLLASVTSTVKAEPISHTHVMGSSASSLSHTSALRRSTVMTLQAYLMLSEDEQKSVAAIFSLKPKDYTTFLHYMNDTMDGYEYDQDINPNLILAMHTHDQALYKTYLENVAKADHMAVSQLLKVSLDYTKVLKTLYPREEPIMTPAMRARANTLGSGDVVQLFCRPKSAECSNILGVIKSSVLKSDGARLDLFFVGKVVRQDIVAFAKDNNITASAVLDRHITLNFGNGTFKALEKESSQSLTLPYLLVRRDGKSIPVDLGDSHA